MTELTREEVVSSLEEMGKDLAWADLNVPFEHLEAVCKKAAYMLEEQQTPCASIISNTDNLMRTFKSMHKRLEPGNKEHSSLIDLVNHADTIVREIRSTYKRARK